MIFLVRFSFYRCVRVNKIIAIFFAHHNSFVLELVEMKKRVSTKVVVLGDTGVGKTCLLQTYVNSEFTTLFKPTIGADFLTKELIVGDRNVGLQIWDTAGMERFHSLAVPFYRGAEACLLVYDITNLESFKNLAKWRQNMLSNTKTADGTEVCFVVIGTKLDLEQNRAVPKRDAEAYAQTLGMPYFEVSSMNNINVELAFQEIAIRTRDQADKIELNFGAPTIDDDAVVDLDKEDREMQEQKKQKKKECC
eukprot:c4658_g1_i1.p1 GENE.c4658_g1_i1~~c4658_g1_i1.p1  ORF type:complete len:250 (+),score=52.58 c4658_g1_i1:623-1372(+)